MQRKVIFWSSSGTAFSVMMFSKALTALLLSKHVFSSPIREAYHTRDTSLNWAPCDLDFSTTQQAAIDAHGVPLYCSTLKVPLDYTNSKSNVTLDLQLIKIEASKQPVKGSIIMNPGGPGASGIEEISSNGPLYREIFGGQWNVIGFDARYVNSHVRQMQKSDHDQWHWTNVAIRLQSSQQDDTKSHASC